MIRSLQPRHFAEFRCLGADCEDTCCDGWAVAIDKPTYQKCQQHPDPTWHSSFEKLITINTTPTDYDYARIQLSTTTCPFFSAGLCAIHRDLGEEYLSVTCASFPRVRNVVDQVVEKSLDLGCPEAARRVLLDPERIVFEEVLLEEGDLGASRSSALDTANGARPGKPDRYFHAVRRFIVELLQNRAFPMWKRILILGLFCDKVQELSLAGAERQIPELVQAYPEAISSGLFETALNQFSPQPAVRMETVVELILARITSDFTNRQFLACYKEFMEGCRWGPDASLDKVCERHRQAHTEYAAPFLNRNEHILEQYLVNYVYRTLFPFGPQESTYGLRDQNIERSIHGEFMLLAAYYSMVETLLGGIAGFHQESFGATQVIRLIYTFTRTFEHSLTFPAQALKMIEETGLNTPEGVAVLVKP